MTYSSKDYKAPHLPGSNAFDDLRVDIAEVLRIADQISRVSGLPEKRGRKDGEHSTFNIQH